MGGPANAQRDSAGTPKSAKENANSFPNDATSFPNWRLLLDEITSIRERMDELTRGQRQIQQSLATKGSRTNGSLARGLRHASHAPVQDASIEDDTGSNRLTRRQTTKGAPPSLGDQSRLPSSPSTAASASTAKTPSHSRVNHFVAMAEKELKFVFEQNTKTKDSMKELNEQVQKKCKRVSERYAGDLSMSLSESQHLRKVVRAGFKLNAEKLELLFDSVVGIIIFLNAIFVGLSMDSAHSESGVFLAIDIIFGCTFWAEMLIKLRVHGWRRRYCCGRLDDSPNNASLIDMPPSRVSCGESFSNCFDLTLIIIDTLQLISVAIPGAKQTFSALKGSLFRVVRLLRLTRILRLLRARVFKDLLSMIQGMMGGLGTLFWSLVLYLLFIYVVALVFREIVGKGTNIVELQINNTKAAWYFRTVSRSMFTVFRCSFGDCSTANGTPIFENIDGESDAMIVFLGFIYSGFVFVVMIGLFNVISAIFVESTMAAAAGLAADKQRSRLDDPMRWAVNFMQLLTALMRHQWPEDNDFLDALSHSELTNQILERLQREEISRELFDNVIETDGNALRALEELDIQMADHKYLSDILDPDNSNTIGVFELMDGLQRLRGDPRRSDIIAVDLMVRSIQLKIDDIWVWTKNALGSTAETAAAPNGSFGVDAMDAFPYKQFLRISNAYSYK